MSEEAYRIFFSGKSPVDPDGKAVESVWKKADSLTDFLSWDTLDVSATKSVLSLLYDRENLYVRLLNSTCRDDLYQMVNGTATLLKSYGEIMFSAGETMEHCLHLFADETGNYRYSIDEVPGEKEKVKHFFFFRKEEPVCTLENIFIIPLSLLGIHSSDENVPIRFGSVHSRRDPQFGNVEHRSGTICSFGSYKGSRIGSSYSGISQWKKAFLTQEEAPAKTYSMAGFLLEKNRRGTVCLDAGKDLSQPYKNILGMNNSPRIRLKRSAAPEITLFKKLAPARVRHHDAALNDPGYALIDVSRIFPLFKADHNDPECYDFGPTDLCLSYVKECGVPIEFRFGESIEHCGAAFRVKPPADQEKWVQICINILRHYTEGWAEGMYLDIPYASLWEEPNNDRLFAGSYEEYLSLYKHFSLKMKERFPNLKVGGPQSMGLGKLDEFASFCQTNLLPLDFLAITGYGRTPEYFVSMADSAKRTACQYGFDKAEISLAEWHYCPRSWAVPPTLEEAACMENAAYTVASLIKMQDRVDMAYYYLWASFGFYGAMSSPDKPYNVYYGLCFYTEFIRKNGSALPVETTGPETPGVYMLASQEKDNGKIHVLAARFKSVTEEIGFDLPAAYRSCTVKSVADDSPDGEKVQTYSRAGEDEAFVIPFPERSYGIYLLEFEKK